jgi:ABC-type branched-subunit amino acid transport system ATPase component/ABC-type branched-subunit amino acid transport system permease subunit
LRDSFSRTWGWWLLVAVAAIGYPLYTASEYVYFVAGLVGVYALVGIGMNILYGLGGQVSLAQGSIVGVGAYVAGALAIHAGWNMWVASAAGMAAGALIGIVMGLPSLRLSTWYFALITLAFSEVVLGLVHHFDSVTGGANGLVGIPPVLTSSGLYWVILAANSIGLALYGTFATSRLGRGLVAIKEGGEAGTVSGVPAARLKLIAFGVAGAYAGAAGSLFAIEQQVVTPDQFTMTFSVFFIVILVAGGVGRWLGPVIGALVFFAVPEFLTSLETWRMVIYGAALLLFMAFAPEGVLGAVDQAWARLRGRRRGARASQLEAAPAERAEPAILERELPEEVVEGRGDGAGRLVVDQVTVSFGGVKALDAVSMTVESGVVHGLIGPNGSGKTTLLNALTSIYVPDSGTVRLNGRTLTGTPPHKLARLGIARTFQTPRLLKELSVWENVMLGGFSVERATAAEALLRLPRALADNRRLGDRAYELLEDLGLAGRAATRAVDLPHGQQRMIELARALMVEPRLLLLDEPAAGLSGDELAVLDQLVRSLQHGGMTVVIVEHHIGWVRELCEQVTVLDQGRVISSGVPDAVFDDARVRETYLGVVA